MASYLLQKFQNIGLLPFSEEKEDEGTVDLEKRQDIERTGIQILRSLLLAQHSPATAKDVDDSTIRRFLRARDLDVEKASYMLMKYLEWRREFVPNGFISPAEIPNDLSHNKLFMQGYDKTGRPVVLVFASRHKPTTVDEFKRFVTFSLDRICARMPNGHDKFTAIADLKGWGYSNSDIRGYLAALSILQDCYPERLGKLLIVHAPYVFTTAWKMVYPFIDDNTKKKITFVEDTELQSTLLEVIDESQLSNTYGGKLNIVPIQEC